MPTDTLTSSQLCSALLENLYPHDIYRFDSIRQSVYGYWRCGPLSKPELLEMKSLIDTLLAMPDEQFEVHSATAAYVVCVLSAMGTDDGPPIPHCGCAICISGLHEVKAYLSKKALEQESREPKDTAPRLRRESFVYAMVNTRNGFTKIGFSSRPKLRENTLQSEEPEIQMLFWFKGTRQLERVAHERFAAQRIRGEWFDLSETETHELRELLAGGSQSSE